LQTRGRRQQIGDRQPKVAPYISAYEDHFGLQVNKQEWKCQWTPAKNVRPNIVTAVAGSSTFELNKGPTMTRREQVPSSRIWENVDNTRRRLRGGQSNVAHHPRQWFLGYRISSKISSIPRCTTKNFCSFPNQKTILRKYSRWLRITLRLTCQIASRACQGLAGLPFSLMAKIPV
jgi:hypothetical protein